MKNTIYIFSLFQLLIISSCVQDVYNSHAQGIVVDALNGAPIEGATVELFYSHGGSILGSNSDPIGTLDDLITNNKGEFNSSFRKGKNYSDFDMLIKHPDFYPVDNNGGYYKIKWNDRKNIKVQLMPKAELVIDVRNTKGGNKLNFGTSSPPWSWGIYDIVGPNTFKQYSGKFPSNDTVKIGYTIYTQGSINPVNKYAAIFCPAHQITTFIIEY